jgi:hypothetical protein
MTPAGHHTTKPFAPQGAPRDTQVRAAIELLLLNARFEAAALIARAVTPSRSAGRAESQNTPSARK